jgi:hypothetical protein
MEIYILLVLTGVLLALLEVHVLEGYTVADCAGVVALLVKHYHSNCVILLHSPTDFYTGKYVTT